MRIFRDISIYVSDNSELLLRKARLSGLLSVILCIESKRTANALCS